MSEQKLPYLVQKKPRNKGKIKDVLREKSVEESPLGKSLDNLLTVQKAPILQKNNSFAGTSGKQTRLSDNSSYHDLPCSDLLTKSASFEKCLPKNEDCEITPAKNQDRETIDDPNESKVAVESSSNESFVSACSRIVSNDEIVSFKSASDTLIFKDAQSVSTLVPQPSEKEVEPDDATLLPLYEEEIVEVPSFNDTVPDCDNLETCKQEEGIVDEIIKSAIDEETQSLQQSLPEESPDFAETLSSAVNTQAFIEALTEDSVVQIQALLHLRQEELETNISLRSRVLELEAVEKSMVHVVTDVESSYLETYSELVASNEQEMELIKLEAEKRCCDQENKIRDLNEKLLIAEAEVFSEKEQSAVLQRRIEELEEIIRKKDKHCKEELEDLMAKQMQFEYISSAKNEVCEDVLNTYEVENHVLKTTLVFNSLLNDEGKMGFEMDDSRKFDRAAMVADLRRASLASLSQNDSLDELTCLPKRRKKDYVTNTETMCTSCAEDLSQQQCHCNEKYELQFNDSKQECDNLLHKDQSLEEFDFNKSKRSEIELYKIQLEDSIKEMKEALLKMTIKNEDLEKELLSLNLGYHEMERKSNELLVRNKELEVKLDNTEAYELKTKIMEMSEEISKLTNENASLVSTLNEIEQWNSRKERLQTIVEVTEIEESQFQKYKVNESTGSEELSGEERDELEYSDDMINMQIEVDRLTKQNELMQKQIIDLNAASSYANKVENDVIDKNKKLEALAKELKNGLCQLTAENTRLENQCSSLNAALSELKMTQDKLLTEKKEHEAEINDNNDQDCSESVEIKELKKERDELKKKIIELEEKSPFEDVTLSDSELLNFLRIDDRNVRRISLVGNSSSLRPPCGRESNASLLNWSRATDATQYLEYNPKPSAEAESQTDPMARRGSLEEDLQTSWTERCEVEQKLAEALAENGIFRQRCQKLETSARQASGLLEAGVPSTAIWLQLRSCINDITSQATILSAPQDVMEQPIQKLERTPVFDAKPSNNSNYFIPSAGFMGGRSSPEGGRESPKALDGVNTSDNEVNVRESENDSNERLIQTEDLILDPNICAVIETFQEFYRCLGGDEDVCDKNSTLNSTLNLTLSDRLGAQDLEELWRRLKQMKEEAGRLLTHSRRTDPAYTMLQDKVRSLEQEVSASDKQVRSIRAFLEEQAAERELERDEAIRQTEELTEALRSRDRLLAAKEILEQDLEMLEQQLKESKTIAQEETDRRTAAELTLQQTIQKVATLRGVLESLEFQLAQSNEQLEAARVENARLQERFVKFGQESLDRENAQSNSYSDTLAYVARLEEELTNLRDRAEAMGPESLVDVRAALRELEIGVMRRTRELELVQVAWNALSSASEELSSRDHVDATRCPTPDEMAGEACIGLLGDVERLKERLAKHGRVEEGAIKRIKELELVVSKSDALQAELEAAYSQVDRFLSENEVIKKRLEVERPRIQDLQTIETLEKRVRQLEKELEVAEENARIETSRLAEKCRREARLQETLERSEDELRMELEAVQQAQDELKEERRLRLAAEERLQEMTFLSRDGNQISKRSMDSSISTSKKVRFNKPESFVGESITPIVNSSILRDAHSGQNDWIGFDSPSRKPLPFDNLSSVAALQLSPRGAFVQSDFSIQLGSDIPLHLQNSSYEKKKEQSSMTQQSEHKNGQKEKKEILALSTKIKEAQSQIKMLKEAHKKEIESLQEQMIANKISLKKELQEMEKAKTLVEETLKRLHVHNETSESELKRYVAEVKELNGVLKSVKSELEIEKEKNSDLQKQFNDVATKLMKQHDETLALKESLRTAFNEVESVKTENCQLSSRGVKFEETSQKLNDLLKEREVLISREAERNSSLKLLQDEKNQLSRECEKIKIHLMKMELEVQELQENRALVEELKKELDLVKCERQEEAAVSDRLRAEYQNLQEQLIFTENEMKEKLNQLHGSGDGDRTRLEQLCMNAAAKVSNLGTCLESSLMRCASLEAEMAILRACLENSEKKVVELENELKETQKRANALIEKSPSDDSELETAKLCVENLADQLQKKEAALLKHRNRELELKKALMTAVQLHKESTLRESDLKRKLDSVEEDLMHVNYLADTQDVNVRGLQRLHQHGMALQRLQGGAENLDPRMVRSAGAEDDHDPKWKKRAQRLESHRNALIWQKKYLINTGVQIRRSRASDRRGRHPKLRTVAFMVVAILRMRYLVRRWRSRLPPLVSTSHRGREQPLMLTSPPCKDPGLRLSGK